MRLNGVAMNGVAMNGVAMDQGGARRVDLDWIRVAAFGLVILYHIAMLYVPFDFHVKSDHRVAGLELLMWVVNPWRLGLLFFVSGCATRFMTTGRAAGRLAAGRSRRLLLPLALGMAVIVPPQAYLELVEKAGYAQSFTTFWLTRYFSFATVCEGSRCLILPTWNHLWFVAYLWAYTMVLAASIAVVGRPRLGALGRGIGRLMGGCGVVVLPILALALFRIVLYPRFPQIHNLVDDWYDHALYGFLFLLGFLVAHEAAVWQAMSRWRWVVLGAAAILYAFVVLGRVAPPPEPGLLLTGLWRAAYGAYQWCCIVAVFGFGRLWLTADGPARRYLTDAVFTWYIVHQTAIVIAAHALRGAGLPAWAEAAIIVAATVAACGLSHEIVRRLAWARPWFGLKPA